MTEFAQNAGKAVYFSIGHGFGDNLMATAVIAGIKEEFPDMRIFVFTKRRSEIFENNPDVTACYDARIVMGKNPSLYKRPITLTQYRSADFRNRTISGHVIGKMYELAGVKIANPIYKPRIYLTSKELDYRNGQIQRLPWPLVAVAPSGKIKTKIPNKFYDIEKWQQLAVLLKKANITVIQVGDKREGPLLQGAKNWRNLGHRKTAAVLRHCDAVISHEGEIIHLATAVNTPCIVLFGGAEDPEALGYPCNINITAELPCSPCWLEKPVFKDMLTPELIMTNLNQLLANISKNPGL